MSFDEPDGLPDATDDDLALSAYLDGVASPAERARVDADPVLAARLSRYRVVAALLAGERAAVEAAGAGAETGAATGAAVEAELAEPGLAAALDRARAAALTAVAAPVIEPAADPTAPLGRVSARPRASHPRRRTGRWAVQVVGLAAALLVAMGAVALFGNRDDDGSVALDTAEAPTTGPAAASFEAATEPGGSDASASAAEDDGGGRDERAVTAQAAEAARSEAAPSGASAPLPAPPAADLGTYASVDELVAGLGSGAADPTATRPGSAGSTTAADSGVAASACAPPGATVLGTATVARRAVLVTEVTDGSGRRSLVGLDPADCARVFDRPR